MPSPKSVYARAIDIYNRRDWDRLPEAYATDVEWLDRRALSYWSDFQGVEQLRDWLETTVEVVPDIILAFEVLDSRPGLAVVAASVRGHSAEGGGEMEMEWGEIVEVTDERITRREFFDDGRMALAVSRER